MSQSVSSDLYMSYENLVFAGVNVTSLSLVSLTAGGGVSHAGHDASPGLRPAAGSPNARRGCSNAGPVETASGR